MNMILRGVACDGNGAGNITFGVILQVSPFQYFQNINIPYDMQGEAITALPQLIIVEALGWYERHAGNAPSFLPGIPKPVCVSHNFSRGRTL